MTPPKHIQRLNDLLRTELGTAKGTYAWLWSESEELMRPMRVIDTSGAPVFEYRVSERSGLTIPEPVYLLRRTCRNGTKDQWLLALLLPPALTPHQWEQVFGSFQVYPANGEWAPCDPIYLDPGQEPTLKDTWDVINALRQQRQMSALDLDNEVKEAFEYQDRQRENVLFDDIDDARPAFDNVPGAKGSVSFPSVVTA